ncbi:MAG: RNA methyltransferase [Burkholderiales bacterium]
MSSPDALDRVRVVLCQTSHPGNIGAAARAMKTMGLSRLILVRPRTFPHTDANAFAAGALDVLRNAVTCDNLDRALEGTVLAVAATSRERDLAHQTVDCREACRRLALESRTADVALVFGPERTGLTSREVSKCNLTAAIPANPAYVSLNIAQAVQVFAYELRMASMVAAKPPRLQSDAATHEDVEHFHRQLAQTLYEIGFLDPDQPRKMMQRLRRLFARARLEKEEVNIFLGLLKAIRPKVE